MSPTATASPVVLRICGAVLCVVVALTYYFSNPVRMGAMDHTNWAARLLVNGYVGTQAQPPAWMERSEYKGWKYTPFPLGAVLTMLPVAVLEEHRIIDYYPSSFLAACIGLVSCLFGLLLANSYPGTVARKLVVAAFPVFATWMWETVAMAGSWQLANGMAVAGQMVMLYLIVVVPSPFLAGVMFATAFGNRTELLILTPLLLYLLWDEMSCRGCARSVRIRGLFAFMLPVAVLLALTGWYNYVRFDSPFDFGYMKITSVSGEYDYRYGLLSLNYIPHNAYWMLIGPWRQIDRWPWLIPGNFGCSIFLASPFLLTLFRLRSTPHHRTRLVVAWTAILITTLILWCHGNSGGVQFGYRYALELLPWCTLVLLETAPPHVGVVEVVLFFLSLAISAYGVYVFLWIPLVP